MESEILYKLDGKYHQILDLYGVDTGAALVEAGFPKDYFEQDEPVMNVTQYYNFIGNIGRQNPSPEVAISAARSEQALKQSPKIYSAYLSENAKQCIRRIAMYKQVMGLVRYNIEETKRNFYIELSLADDSPIPIFLAEFEFCFLLRIIRGATGKHVKPLDACIGEEGNVMEIEDYLGCDLHAGERAYILFSNKDMELPFKTNDDLLWMKYEPELFRKIYGMTDKGEYSRRVQSALIYLIPTGNVNLDDVAREMSLSRRTLHRKLGDEGTSFREQLDGIRMHMAKYYLENTGSSAETIAYLLAYMEHNSFSRSFRKWTGMTTSEYRRHKKKNKNNH